MLVSAVIVSLLLSALILVSFVLFDALQKSNHIPQPWGEVPIDMVRSGFGMGDNHQAKIFVVVDSLLVKDLEYFPGGKNGFLALNGAKKAVKPSSSIVQKLNPQSIGEVEGLCPLPLSVSHLREFHGIFVTTFVCFSDVSVILII